MWHKTQGKWTISHYGQFPFDDYHSNRHQTMSVCLQPLSNEPHDLYTDISYLFGIKMNSVLITNIITWDNVLAGLKAVFAVLVFITIINLFPRIKDSPFIHDCALLRRIVFDSPFVLFHVLHLWETEFQMVNTLPRTIRWGIEFTLESYICKQM